MNEVNVADMFIWPSSKQELILVVVDFNKTDYVEDVAICLEIGHPKEWYHKIRVSDLQKIGRKVI